MLPDGMVIGLQSVGCVYGGRLIVVYVAHVSGTPCARQTGTSYTSRRYGAEVAEVEHCHMRWQGRNAVVGRPTGAAQELVIDSRSALLASSHMTL